MNRRALHPTPSWLQVALVVVVVLVVVLTGLPVVAGGVSMGCATCPATVAQAACATVVVSLLLFVALLSLAVACRQPVRARLLLYAAIDRPPRSTARALARP